MKKITYLLSACVLCGTLVFTACSGESQKNTDETSEVKVTGTESTEVEPVETEATELEVSQADIEENIIGK